MARFVYALNQSLDGYIDHDAFAPGPELFRHFVEHAQSLAGSLYGRVMYETMRYWDDDQPAWNDDERAFAEAWRKQHKWVVSRTLGSVGPNATLIADDIDAAIHAIKRGHDGEVEVAGPTLAHHVTGLGLIDEYRIYLHPVVVGRGKPYFARPRPRLALMGAEPMPGGVVKLAYQPA